MKVSNSFGSSSFFLAFKKSRINSRNQTIPTSTEPRLKTKNLSLNSVSKLFQVA
ncbi:Uncharacterised protein [Mycoplasmoides gallisepticum]|uniref:Uncharacterized protein n=1 Tax=Mycoplasmoides gallisepticum TaxID=2096 RepID=A0A3B0PE24_MYCGL|nr:Uncharacterised protein [Mycoplasmoides gallisepticum]